MKFHKDLSMFALNGILGNQVLGSKQVLRFGSLKVYVYLCITPLLPDPSILNMTACDGVFSMNIRSGPS